MFTKTLNLTMVFVIRLPTTIRGC